MKILVLNAGSSSQKSCLYELEGSVLPEHPPKPLWLAAIDWVQGVLKVKTPSATQEIEVSSSERPQGIATMLKTLVEGETKVLGDLAEIDIVGHRVVHGGTKYAQAVLITPEVKAVIAELIPLAPTHNPSHLQGIEAIEDLLRDVPQVASFDTAFHTTIPNEAAIYPLPYQWSEKGIHRYGFHGISHKFCSKRAAQIVGKPLKELKLVVCHLGNGCSMTAIKNGVSVDTTMGFTPLEGLMMGTRSGSLDPAILIYLMREHGLTPDELNLMLNKESGLKGVSGISGDLREVLTAADEGNPRAVLAFNMYIHRIKANLGAMVAILGGLDALIFTAGVGENSPIVREKVCTGLEFLGIEIDTEKNKSRPVDQDIASSSSRVHIIVVHTEEDWAIAKECWHIHNQIEDE